MSNALAIAAVTAVLKDVLDNALIDQSVSGAVGGTVTVSAMPPDRIETGENEEPRLNLFLYQVTPNAALRNLDLPSHNGRGQRLSNAPLALDLHYLLSAYGAQDFEAEILLGYAMQMLHETPVLARDAIRHALAAPSPVDGAILPPAFAALSASDLADQLELVRISPQQLSTEEGSRLWTAFQSKYRPSAAYLATVVLIRSELPTRQALPVLTRGEPDPVTGRDAGIMVRASLVPPYPALDTAEPPDDQNAVRMGELLTLRGSDLEGDSVAVRFTHVRSGTELELVPEPGATRAGMDVRIPPDPPPGAVVPGSPQDPDIWRAGVYAVGVVVRRAGEDDFVTNALPVVLAPRIDAIAAAAGAGGDVTISVTVSPPVGRTQQARLGVGMQDIGADALGSGVESTRTLTFTSGALPAGMQWVRVRVDEAESLLIDRTTQPPSFDAGQQVVIP